MRYGEITAAPASRRLGRAGLEAPPRSGPFYADGSLRLERHFPLKIGVPQCTQSLTLR